MNKNIILLAETGSDITPEIAAKYGIFIVPMHVQLGDVTKDDGSFPPEEVCEYYEKSGKVPKTSGSTPEDFEIILNRIQNIRTSTFCTLLTLQLQPVHITAAALQVKKETM